MPVTFTWSITPAASTTTGSSSSNSATTPGSASGATALRDWALDPITGDLATDETGDALFNSGADGIASDIDCALKAWQGEWDDDTSVGFPWLQDVLGKKYDSALVRRDIQKLVMARPGVQSLVSYSGTYDNVARELDVAFVAACDTGELINGSLQVSQGEG